MKELRLDLEATISQAVDGHGHAHYGYWPDGAPDTPSLQALAAAQQAYFELLAATLPAGTRTILDIGSGSGSNAAELARRGFAMECLCPSPYLNALARAKLPKTVPVHDCRFEDYRSERRFNLCLFAESFHYIVLDTALAQLDRYADPHVLIFDYFRRDPEAGIGGTRSTHAQFRNAVSAQGVFEIVSDEDLTETILPTFAVLDYMRTDLIGPFVDRARTELGARYPVRAQLVEWLFGRRIDKIGRSRGRVQSFSRKFEYRLVLMRRRQA